MLKITVIAVGKLKEKFWVAACDEYLKRLRPYAKVTVAEIPDVDPARSGGVEAAASARGQAFWRRCRKARTSSSWPSKGSSAQASTSPATWTIWPCAAQASSPSSSAVPTA